MKVLASQKPQIPFELGMTSDAAAGALTGLPGAVLAHPLRLGRLAGAGRDEHRGVFNAQLYVEKPRGQYHTVIFGEGFLDRVTILDSINADPGFICKRKVRCLFNIEDRQNASIFSLAVKYTYNSPF